MDKVITPSNLIGEITAPPSKSYAHRLMIAVFLSGKKGVIKNVGESKDCQATLGALSALGARVEKRGADVEILREQVLDKTEVYCAESGSTLRFLFPIASALGINAEFTGEKRLMERPLGELVDVLNKNGANICGREITGKLKSGEYQINAGISSQYITGLLFALPLLDGDSNLILEGETVSKGYIDITLDVLKKFSVDVQKTDKGYYIKGNQKYVLPSEQIITEGDYSGSAFMLSAGAIGGSVKVSGLFESKQGDSQIVDVLEMFGAKVERGKDFVKVEKGSLNAIELDCENIPDLVQIIAVVASFAKGESVLKRVDRLKIKESDRVQAVIDTLSASKISARYEGGNLYVLGGRAEGGIFYGGNDHRTVMSSAILASYATSNSQIVGAEAITKSYPKFFEDFCALGGKVNG